jgi:predicted ATPase/DNA-binding winged helix-turn-helix (wHTH) protein
MRKLYDIGGLRLDAEARVLTHDGEPVALGPRAVAVLVALVSRANEAVAKSEIMDAAWPGLVVEEANLAVQISAVRRALALVPGGEGWIKTLARRGYRFVGPVVAVAGTQTATASPVNRRRTNLPQVPTSFVGREREIAEIKQLLPVARLLTLTGTGGIGKTRLALQAGHEVLDAYPDGAWFVDLAPLADQALVAGAVAQVLGLKEEAGKPLIATICRHLRAKELLLVLDNCEHVLGASADLVDELLRETAHVTVVATSRQALHVASEHTYPVGVLPLADPKASAAGIARADAVKLFVDRARQHRPRFDLDPERSRAVAQICVRLDGLPLAIELAAARVAVLPVEEIVRLLDERFRLLTRGGELPRQQTLRAMIDWSYELLTDAEQLLFARLSAFAGGWTVAAAEAVGADAAIAREDVVYLLIALIEKSLVVADEDGNRYRMLEIIRQYASEKLAAAADAETVRTRHRDFYLALAEEADQKLRGPEQTEWLARLAQEHDNLRAAHERCLAAAGTHAGLRLCWTLRQFWWTHGHLSEGREWCARMLAQAGDAATSERADALNTAGALAYLQSDYAAAKALHEESLAIRRALGDRRGVATSLSNLGAVACDHGEFASAIPQFEESLAILRELNDPWGVAIALGNLGRAANEQGEFASARARIEESLAIKRTLGNRAGIASSLASLANVAHGQGDYAAANALHGESLAIHRELGNRTNTATELNNIGSVAYDQGEYARARESFVEGLSMLRELGDRRNICASLEGLASLAAVGGRPLDASRLFGASERLREEIDAPLAVVGKPRYERSIAVARAAPAMRPNSATPGRRGVR